MNFIERKIQELSEWKPELTAPGDLDSFWERTLAESDKLPLEGTRELVTTPLLGIDAYRITFKGYGGTPINGWYLVPSFLKLEAYPTVVMLHGYTGSAGIPENHAAWLLAGYAVCAIDIRSQGGATGDLEPQTDGMVRGWITKGITSPETCYYKSIAVDCLRAVEFARSQPETDTSRTGVFGSSQGGGLAMIVAALGKGLAFAVADVPNMCHMDWGIFNTTGSVTEAAEYVSRYPDRLDAVLTTLSYFDNMNLADRIRIPIQVSVSMKDPICPPEAVFAAYNRIVSDKKIVIYPFMGHTNGEKHIRVILEFIQQVLASTSR